MSLKVDTDCLKNWEEDERAKLHFMLPPISCLVEN